MTAKQQQRHHNTASAAAMMQNYVYVLSDSHAWIPARVMSMTENGSITVAVPQVENEQSLIHMKYDSSSQSTTTIRLSHYPSRALPLQNVDSHGRLKEVEDMVELSFLHEPAILYNLKARHARGKPYTRTGDIIIAVNPYQWIDGLYSDEKRRAYSSAIVWNAHQFEGDPRSLVEPHVYETSALAYRGLACEGMNQSILVSGESGAGKTETVKILLSHLASVQARAQRHSSSRTDIIVKRVLDSNPLLEAFGNAKTVRNDNSSRFGKFLQLQFDCEDPEYCGKAVPDCLLAGSKCETYLLEKSRVVSHEAETERTYHIFYQLLSAPNEFKARVWEGLVDTDNESFAYVGYTDTHRIEGLSDLERFQQTCNALALIGIKGETFTVLMRAITIVLQLGNLVFEEHPHDDEKAEIVTKQDLAKLSGLMQVDEQTLLDCLTNRTMKAGGDEYKVPLNAIKAKDSCDAFAKEIYSKMFLWLVRTINDATCAEKNYDGSVRGGQYGLIGLLDIFGFESFKVNRFEQLCINYANEKLQQKFTNDVFRSVKQEYEFEGIELAEIQYDDNQNVLNLVEGTTGLISVLNEECIRPKGSDSSFVSKVKSMNKGSDCLISQKLFRNCEFGVKHFAGPVVYDANGFVTKNTDTLPLDLLECAKMCSNDIVRLLNDPSLNGVSSKSPSRAPSRRLIRKSSSIAAETVWTKFRNQLVSLMDNLGRTRTRYIRCIKPNTETKPYLMQHTSTVEQLRCAGVVAAVTISRSAFPNRVEHEEILHRFKSLWGKGEQRLSPESPNASHSSDEVRRDVTRLLTPALRELETPKDGKIVKAFVIGKTRTYFRAGALEHLEAERLKGLGGWAIEIQRAARGFLARRLAVRMIKSCITLQCWIRSSRAKRELAQLRENKEAVKVQSLFRMIIVRKGFLQYKRAKAEKLRRQKEERERKEAAGVAAAAAAAQHQPEENGAQQLEAELVGDEKGEAIEIEFDPTEPADDFEKENQFAPELDLEAQDEFENKSFDDISKSTSKETMPPRSQDKEGASWFQRHRRLVIIGTVVVIAAVVGIVVGVVVAGGGGGDGDNSSPQATLKQFLTANSLGDGTEFEDPESYQSKAYTWLKDDPALGGYSDERTLQRYAMACVYYATYSVRTVITDIVSDSQEIPAGWDDTTNWLSNTTECNWFGTTCKGEWVTEIDLGENGLTGSFPAEVSYLAANLQKLDIQLNDIWNVGEAGNEWLGNLTALRSLNIGNTFFDNEGFPTAIGLLTNLEELDCWNCLFDGPLDGNIFSNMNALSNLEISGPIFGGTVPSQIVALPNLQFFYAVGNGWTNDLSFIQDFAKMDEIWVDDNPDMGGTIPSALYSVPTLASMSFTNCNVAGSIPTEIGLVSNLVSLWMYTNPLTGTVPSEIGNLPLLEILDIEDTDIGGTMPDEVCELTNSFVLDELYADCAEDPPEIVCDCCTYC